MTITINGSGTITGASTLATAVANPTLTTPNIDSAQIATVSGTAPLYMCRAWVNFNGTGTVAIRASGNVSSITDNGTGDYTVNFATAMPDANYSSAGSCSALTAGREAVVTFNIESIGGTIINPTTTAQRISTTRANIAGDPTFVNISVFR